MISIPAQIKVTVQPIDENTNESSTFILGQTTLQLMGDRKATIVLNNSEANLQMIKQQEPYQNGHEKPSVNQIQSLLSWFNENFCKNGTIEITNLCIQQKNDLTGNVYSISIFYRDLTEEEANVGERVISLIFGELDKMRLEWFIFMETVRKNVEVFEVEQLVDIKHEDIPWTQWIIGEFTYDEKCYCVAQALGVQIQQQQNEM